MTKFIVDSDTLQDVCDGLGDLRTVLCDIPGMTKGVGPTPLGGQMVLDALERLHADWRAGGDVIGREIESAQERLGEAKRAYALIDEKMQATP